MTHVYVETNFIVDLLRPFPTGAAAALLARHGSSLTLHVPWCAFTEAKRTLEEVIREDLGFVDNAGRFLRRLGAARGPAVATTHEQVSAFIDQVRTARRDALFDYLDRLDALAGRVHVVDPTPAAAQRTRDLFRRKMLKPFDEMALGTVLVDAEARHPRGESPLYFCNKNTRDFEPTGGNGLREEYGRVGLTYIPSFDVPDGP